MRHEVTVYLAAQDRDRCRPAQSSPPSASWLSRIRTDSAALVDADLMMGTAQARWWRVGRGRRGRAGETDRDAVLAMRAGGVRRDSPTRCRPLAAGPRRTGTALHRPSGPAQIVHHLAISVDGAVGYSRPAPRSRPWRRRPRPLRQRLGQSCIRCRGGFLRAVAPRRPPEPASVRMRAGGAAAADGVARFLALGRPPVCELLPTRLEGTYSYDPFPPSPTFTLPEWPCGSTSATGGITPENPRAPRVVERKGQNGKLHRRVSPIPKHL